MGVEQGGGPSSEEVARFNENEGRRRGRSELVTDDLDNYGRAENTRAIQNLADKENARYDGLKQAEETGKFQERTDEKGYVGLSRRDQEILVEVAKESGREAAKQTAGRMKEQITKGDFGIKERRELASDISSSEFGLIGSVVKQNKEAGIEAGILDVQREKEEMDLADRRAKRPPNKSQSDGGQ